MSDRSRKVAQVAVAIILGIIISGVVNTVWWYLVFYIFPEGSFSRKGGAIIMGIYGALFGCVSGIFSGFFVSILQTTRLYGAAIGTFSSGFVLVAPVILFGGDIGIADAKTRDLIWILGHLLCGALIVLILSIIVGRMNLAASEWDES